MNLHLQRALVSLSVFALTTGMVPTAWAGTESTGGPRPTLVSVNEAWQNHWAQHDLQALRSSVSMKPDALASGGYGPDEPISLRLAADVLVHLYGAGGVPGNPLDQAVSLGLIRHADFADGQILEVQNVPRQLFALFLTRALGVNGAEDVATDATPNFVDSAAIDAKYRAAVAVMQGEGLLIGDGEGHFAPAQPVTFAQAVRTMLKVSTWAQQRVERVSGLHPANATYLFHHKAVSLVSGVATQPAAPGSASMEVTRLTERQAAGDLDGDGRLDVAAVVVRSTGGSGTFYYLSAVTHDGTPVESAFLGDRVAVQNVRIVSGKVAVDMLTRSAADPMVTKPSIKETRFFQLQAGALIPSAS